MANAIQASLEETSDVARLKARADEFSVERATQRYAELLLGKQQNTNAKRF